MKKFLFLGVLILLLAGCESKSPSYGWLDVYNETGHSIFVEIRNENGTMCVQQAVSYCDTYSLPEGDYSVRALRIGYDKTKSVFVRGNQTTKVYFY